MMTTKQRTILSLIVLAITFIGGYALGASNKAAHRIPRSFTIVFSQDDSSASGTRQYEGSYTFSKGALTEGYHTYSASTLAGDTYYRCIVSGGTLVDADTQNPCKIEYARMPLTREAIIEGIKEGILKTLSECAHGEVCYKITRG